MAEMTSRERVQQVLNGQLPDRVPFNFWMDRDKMAQYDEKWGSDFRLTHFGVDIIEAFRPLNWWGDLEAKVYNDGKTVWLMEPMVDSMKSALDVPLPDPADPAVYADIAEKRAENPDKAIFVLIDTPLAAMEGYRLAEGMFTDLYDMPEVIHEYFTKMQPVIMESVRRVCEMDIDVLYIAHDICARGGAMISPNMLREFHFEYMKPAIDLAHEMGRKVFHHTDGYVLDILNLFIEYGFDGINPIEHRYNDPYEFMRRTNGKLIVYGALDNCSKIPDGSPDDVREHVREVFNILGKTGRLMMSTHDIPGSCPLENIEAMVDEIKRCTY